MLFFRQSDEKRIVNVIFIHKYIHRAHSFSPLKTKINAICSQEVCNEIDANLLGKRKHQSAKGEMIFTQ